MIYRYIQWETINMTLEFNLAWDEIWTSKIYYYKLQHDYREK